METKKILTGAKEYQAPSIEMHVVKAHHLLCVSGEDEDDGGNEKVDEKDGTWAPAHRSLWD